MKSLYKGYRRSKNNMENNHIAYKDNVAFFFLQLIAEKLRFSPPKRQNFTNGFM